MESAHIYSPIYQKYVNSKNAEDMKYHDSWIFIRFWELRFWSVKEKYDQKKRTYIWFIDYEQN